MAVIERQIEPLKKLKEILDRYEISRFGSIGEIRMFIKNYESEKKQIPTVIENEFDTEVAQLYVDLSQ